MKINEIKKALGYLHTAKITACLIGQRGVGKSEVVKQYAKENSFNLLDLRLGQMADAGDIIGLADFLRNPNGEITATKYMMPHYFQQTTEGKWIIFLDEANRAPKDILQAIFELILDRSISTNGFKLGDESQIIMSINPPTDDYTTNDFDDEAFYDRLCFIPFEPSKDEWISYADAQGVERSIISFIEKQRELLEPELADFNIDTFAKPSRRSWFAVDRLAKLKPSIGIFKELSFGLVGHTAAMAYFEHLANHKEDINELDVLNDYKKVKKLVERFSSIENQKTALLKNVCDRLKLIIKDVSPMNEEQAENLVAFITTIPKDMAYNFLKNDLILELDEDDKPVIMTTEGDTENGLLNGTTKASKKLMKYAETHLKGTTISKEFGYNKKKGA